MTKNSSVLCFKLFCKTFDGIEFGKVYKDCLPVDKRSTISDEVFELFEDEDSIRLCVCGRYVMIWYMETIRIYNIKDNLVEFREVCEFLSYFKIPLNDIV